MTQGLDPSKLQSALPFWLSLALVPVVLFAAKSGNWALILPPLASWGAFSALDRLAGLETRNADPETPDSQLFWYRAITLLWFPIQFAVTFGLIWYVDITDHLNSFE